MYGHCIWHRRLLRYQSAICVYARAVASFIALALTAPSRLLQQLVNLLLLRGNFGKPGGGISPIRGHSNVQGDRTVGIDEKPSQEYLDRVRDVFDSEPRREHGHHSVESIAAMQNGIAQVFIRDGWQLLSCGPPDTERSHAAMRKLALTVGIAIKLNRVHLVHGVTLLGHLDPVILSRFFGTRRTSRPAPC
jgi:anaerobic selenocysteine-containing dehydrogenase